MNFFKSVMFICVLISCQTIHNKSNDEEGQGWFTENAWKQGWAVESSESVDTIEFKKQYLKNSERWQKAFQFLSSTKLSDLSVGKYEIDGEEVFAIVDRYQTRDDENTCFEAHQKYADIQYLIDGEELIGVVPLRNVSEIVPYDAIKDIGFYSSGENNYHLANQDCFFIFLPGDAHRPCHKVRNNDDVLKIVIKVLILD